MVKIFIDEKEATEFRIIPLSNNTIERIKGDTAKDTQTQVLQNINKCKQFSLQMDESANISSGTQFIPFVRNHTTNSITGDTYFILKQKQNF